MTLKEFYLKYNKKIDEAISKALNEDEVTRDITSDLFKDALKDKKVTAVLVCKEDCVLAGLDIFKRVMLKTDRHVKFITFRNDGSRIRNKTRVMKLIAAADKLLAAERTALNFIQRMSGIATLTDMFVKKNKYKKAKILHTRKTTPNFRLFELMAVKTGGGDFHRISLGSSVLIKDNHIKAAGGIVNVLKLIGTRSKALHGRKLEIEINDFNQIKSLLEYGKGIIDVVMLDNFTAEDAASASKILKQNAFKVEISGNINHGNFELYQNRYADYYSIGMLTHSYKSVDFSLEF